MTASTGEIACTCLRVVVHAGSGRAAAIAAAPVARELPGVVDTELPAPGGQEIALPVGVAAWRAAGFDPCTTDEPAWRSLTFGLPLVAVVHAAAGDTDHDVAWVALAAATRLQHLARCRNAAAATPLFDEILDIHRALHDLSRPLVAADYVHALDTWQWVRRLDPLAGLAVQVAALFHDVERLVSESDVRTEQHAADYAAHKDAHAAGSARVMRTALATLEIEPRCLDRAAALIAGHERPGRDPEAVALADADALSFFSRNAAGFLRYFGAAHTARKIDHTLARMSHAAVARLGSIRHAPGIVTLLPGGLVERR